MALEFETSREDWINSCYNRSGSINTKLMAEAALKTFDAFNEKLKRVESELIIELKRIQKEPELYVYLNSYIQFLVSTKLSRNAIDIRFTFLKSYLRSQGIRIYAEDIKQFVQFPKKIHEIRQPLTNEKIKLLIKFSSKRMIAMMLILASSGMRVSEVLQITISCLSRYCYQCNIPIQLFNEICTSCNTKKNVIEIQVKAKTTKTQEERIAYMSQESFAALTPLIQGLKNEDYILIKNYDQRITLCSTENSFRDARIAANLVDKYSNGYYHVNIHSFRAFFETEATKILGGDIAHALIGHHKYLDQYFRLTHQERVEKYKTLEPYLAILTSHKLKLENKILKEQANQFEELKKKQAELEAKIERMKLIKA